MFLKPFILMKPLMVRILVRLALHNFSVILFWGNAWNGPLKVCFRCMQHYSDTVTYVCWGLCLYVALRERHRLNIWIYEYMNILNYVHSHANYRPRKKQGKYCSCRWFQMLCEVYCNIQLYYKSGQIL